MVVAKLWQLWWEGGGDCGCTRAVAAVVGWILWQVFGSWVRQRLWWWQGRGSCGGIETVVAARL